MPKQHCLDAACVGTLEGLPPALQRRIAYATESTRHNTRLILNVAFNYGGRAEIVQAIRRMLADGVAPEDIDRGPETMSRKRMLRLGRRSDGRCLSPGILRRIIEPAQFTLPKSLPPSADVSPTSWPIRTWWENTSIFRKWQYRDWERGELWRIASAIPGVHVMADPAGAEAHRFAVSTSGDTLLYGAEGALLFHGTRQSTPWFIAYFALAILSGLIDGLLSPHAPLIPQERRPPVVPA